VTCAEARAALLDADLDTLRPGAPGPLGAHLAACAACRAAADRILAGTGALAAARTRTARTPAAAAAQAARTQGRRLRGRGRRLRVLVPVLAAASLALVFGRGLPFGSGALRPPVAPPPALPPLVEAGGQDVAVISTTRPDITIVWQF
jgi:predicted anti-sigma-YlaC factor YlaD